MMLTALTPHHVISSSLSLGCLLLLFCLQARIRLGLPKYDALT